MGYVRTLAKELNDLIINGNPKEVSSDAFLRKPDKEFEDEINPFAVFFE